jgi:transcriptional regulator with XRE-family HTH domain
LKRQIDAEDNTHAKGSGAACVFNERRKRAGLTQAKVAERLGRYQSFVAAVEGGQRRLDVVEFLDFAAAIGLDPVAAVRRLTKIR